SFSSDAPPAIRPLPPALFPYFSAFHRARRAGGFAAPTLPGPAAFHYAKAATVNRIEFARAKPLRFATPWPAPWHAPSRARDRGLPSRAIPPGFCPSSISSRRHRLIPAILFV